MERDHFRPLGETGRTSNKNVTQTLPDDMGLAVGHSDESSGSTKSEKSD